MALALFTFLLALNHAESHPDYEPPYGEKLNPKPFQYEYGLESTSSSAAFSKKEAQDDRGNVIGEVVVSLPDGRIQTTNYNADFYKGYNADVKYVGTPQYPPEQYQNYNSPKFIPVHLKSRPSAIKQKTERNRYKAPASQSNSGFPYREKNTLQPQLKSIESSDIDFEEETKPQEITFEPEKINSLNNPEEIITRQEKFASDSESMSQKMAKVREDLRKIHNVKESPLNIPQNNAHSEFTTQEKQTFQKRPLSPSKPEKMLEMMKQIRDDLKENNDAIASKTPSLIPETPPLIVIKSHVISKPKDKMMEIMKQKVTEIQKSDKLTINPGTPRKKSFQNRPSRRPDETVVDMKKFRENLKDKSEIRVLRLPSVNPETPPLMIIKSHIMSRPNHEQAELIKEELPNVPPVTNKNVKNPMSIKSHVISAPKPAESIEEIMKKIREDIEDKEHPNKVKLPTLVMKMKPHVNPSPEGMSHVTENLEVSERSTVKPIQDSVVDFMKKVELMKENKNKPNDSIMSVKSRIIQQSKQDGDGNFSMKIMSHVNLESSRLETVPSNEEPTNHKSMFEDKSPFTMFPDQENKTMNKKKNLAIDLMFKEKERKRKEIEVQPVHQTSLPQKEDDNDHQVLPIIIVGIESLAKPQPMIKYQKEQTENPENIKNANAGDWIEIRDRKPVMDILLNVAKKTIRKKLYQKKDLLSRIFG